MVAAYLAPTLPFAAGLQAAAKSKNPAPTFDRAMGMFKDWMAMLDDMTSKVEHLSFDRDCLVKFVELSRESAKRLAQEAGHQVLMHMQKILGDMQTVMKAKSLAELEETFLKRSLTEKKNLLACTSCDEAKRLSKHWIEFKQMMRLPELFESMGDVAKVMVQTYKQETDDTLNRAKKLIVLLAIVQSCFRKMKSGEDRIKAIDQSLTLEADLGVVVVTEDMLKVIAVFKQG